MGVERVEGTILLHVRDTDAKRQQESQRSHLQRRMCYWGYKFEQLCTDPSASVDANQEYCSVVKTKLNSHRILMAAEIDCQRRRSDGTLR
jgi:RAT1-interacting protein